ncbi:uncharacterized protein [Prorops nasuta]
MSCNWLIHSLILAICGLALPQPAHFNLKLKGLLGIFPKTPSLNPGDMRVIYYHEQTIVVVDLGSTDHELHNCNMIEVYEPYEAQSVLGNLSHSLGIKKVKLVEMMKLMHQCELLDKLQAQHSDCSSKHPLTQGEGLTENSLSLLAGIVPGTKWCGPGDIAETYRDLGQNANIDRCCRNHDLCPVKIRSKTTRYNLTNNSVYTKSHCTCDEAFHSCLKDANDPTGNLMGRVFFNILQIPCIENIKDNHQFNTQTKMKFIPAKLQY